MNFRDVTGHEEIIGHLKSMIETDRVGHAYIFGGEKGSGRSTLAYCFAKTLECKKGGTDSCDECRSCHQMETGNHPDVTFVTHARPNTISVDEIRQQVVSTMGIRPYQGKYKIYIIKDGEKMSVAAENALLKTIEEPPQYGIVIIITDNPEKLLPTIRSRCMTIMTKPVREKDIREYLSQTYQLSESRVEFAVSYAEGNLGKAILLATNEDYERLLQSVVDLETNIYEMDMEDIAGVIQNCTQFKLNIGEYLDLMMLWYRDIVVLKVTGNPDKILFKDQLLTIQKQAKYLSFNELEDKAKAITSAKQRIAANARMEDVMRLLILTLKEM